MSSHCLPFADWMFPNPCMSHCLPVLVNKGLTKKTKGSNTLRVGFYKSGTYALPLNVKVFAIRYLHVSKKKAIVNPFESKGSNLLQPENLLANRK